MRVQDLERLLKEHGIDGNGEAEPASKTEGPGETHKEQETQQKINEDSEDPRDLSLDHLVGRFVKVTA
jgi:hypothetical protein